MLDVLQKKKEENMELNLLYSVYLCFIFPQD